MTESTSQQRTVGDWVLGSLLGSGSFAVVWKAHHKITNQPAAVKEINLNKLNAKLRSSLESEVSILKRISHQNVVKLYEVVEHNGRLFLIMEFCSGGDLAQRLRASGKFPEATVRLFMQHLAAGLYELASRHLVHRDLKPQNLLLTTHGPDPLLKIADFGFARALGPQLMAETLCGSPLYMAPEILLSQRYDAKADLWSVGAILFEMLSGSPPYSGANQVALLRAMREREARLSPELAATLTPQCRALVHSLLRRNPVERLSFEEFFRHPFLRDDSCGEDDVFAFDEAPAPAVPVDTGTGGGSCVPAHHSSIPMGQFTENPRSSHATPLRGASHGEDRVGGGIGGDGGGGDSSGGIPRLVSMRIAVPPRARVSAKPIQLGPKSALPPRDGGFNESVFEDEGFVIVASPSSGGSGNIVAPTSALPKPHTERPAKPTQQQETLLYRRPGAPLEAFLLHPVVPVPTSPIHAGHESGGGAGSAGGASKLQTVPWQAASRRQFLYLVAEIFEELATETPLVGTVATTTRNNNNDINIRNKTSREESVALLAAQLSYHLAAAQILDYVISGINAARANGESNDTRRSVHSSVDSADSWPHDTDSLCGEAAAIVQRAQQTAKVLQEEASAGEESVEKTTTTSSNSNNNSDGKDGDGHMRRSAIQVSLPNPWQAGHTAALCWAEQAASEELLGNYSASEKLYARAGMILHFLAVEAKTLPCHPPPMIAPEDEPQLRRCASAAAARWAACATVAAGM